MEIYPILGNHDSNVYLIVDSKVALIDTGSGMDDRIKHAVDKKTGGRAVDIIINTHAHFDHCGGNPKFKGAKVHIHRDDLREMLSGNFYNTSDSFGGEMPMKFDKSVEDGDMIDLGELVLEVLHTPGHTMGSICLYSEEEGLLFSGDTFFADGGVGRVDLGGDPRMMIYSLEKLAKFEIKTLFPGHGRISDGEGQAELSLKIAREIL